MFYIFYFTVLNLIIGQPQFNLYYTDLVSKSNNALEYNCLRIVTNIHGWVSDNRQKYISKNQESDVNNHVSMSYCMNEFSSKFNVEEKLISFPKYTFYELSKQNIVSEQLYFWSAPIDLIENYQLYLNKFDQSLEKEIFYNCTLPRFGPKCEYEFNYSYSNNLSLSELINQYYRSNEYDPDTLTCYQHLKCSRGPYPLCLDWTEICDGNIDCIDDGLDEEYCWKLVINECKDNEYQCLNGQCIPQIFYQDDNTYSDCIDVSDETLVYQNPLDSCNRSEPTFGCEDRTCKENYFTSSCVIKRKYLLMNAMFSIKDNLTSDECWFAIRCMFDRLYIEKSSFCADISLLKSYLDTCPQMLYIPNYPILFGDTYIAGTKNDLKEVVNYQYLHLYICYNHHSQYDPSIYMFSEIIFNNRTCFKGEHFQFLVYDLSSAPITKYYKFIDHLYKRLNQYHLLLNYTLLNCNRSYMYQCINSSKCIPIRILFNIDYYYCPYLDDSSMSIINNNSIIMKQLNKTHFYCRLSEQYMSKIVFNDDFCDCYDDDINQCIDENVEDIDSSRVILFQTICDGFRELSFNNNNESDETECEEWECNNTYTHCDGVWNCPNGKDEIGCDDLSKSICSLNQHLCVSFLTYRFTCLDIIKVNDGNLDCVGGTDEPIRMTFTRRENGLFNYGYEFICMNGTALSFVWCGLLCNNEKTCEYGDDEKFCNINENNLKHPEIRLSENIDTGTDVKKFLCRFIDEKQKRTIIYFKLNDMINSVNKISKNVLPSIKMISSESKSHCHRGLNLRVWLKNNENDLICLCPPSYYGNNCEYQNERISLSIKFRAFSDSRRTQFVIVILLIDDSDERIIHSYQQINYLLLINCQTKYQMNLLYSTRPKNITKNYSIHLDFYENKTLIHRGSLLLPIIFPFLPVYRLALIVDIPQTSNIKNERCSNEECIHGKCIKYSNNQNNLTYCQCNEGWSGKYCHIEHICKCSSGSLCIGISSNNRSICVCPVNRFGPRCILTVNGNNQTKCENDGEYNDDLASNQEFPCICSEGYSGKRCEIVNNKLILSFDKNIILSKEILIHFIRVVENSTHIRSTTFQRINLFLEDLINITWSQQFHIAFVDISNKSYYLIVVQNNYIQSKNIIKMINESDRCPYINELFNVTFVQLNLIRRIKSYHLPCQNDSLNLSCFYDDNYFCLCYQFGEKRLANCLTFDHNMKFNCSGENECENDGECFQDHPECPKKSICKCSECYFGDRCQLTTNGFGLSLDVILGYQIFPYISINNQPFIIKLSLSLTIIFLMIGIVNGILSIITFKHKSICEVGCGLYLLSTSIATLLTTIMFGLKYFILILSHMSIIKNESFLSGQCYSFDFILKSFLSMDQWLNAFIAVERTITVIKGTSFNKKKSKKTAKLVIIILLILISVSCIHDPIYRELMPEIINNDSRQNRMWCIVTYSSNLKIYNSFIHTFHFIGPFIINFLSIIILITKKTRQQFNLRRQQPYKDILYKTIKEHKQLLTAPIVLILLGLPRLILLFISKCMTSADDAWLFLTGYFISFIPPMLTFLIFILPSTFYKEIFCQTFKRYKTNILRWFRIIE